MKKYGLIILLSLFFTQVWAGNEIIPAGSFVINMGITPQTTANGLRPYGLVYDMLQNLLVPVKWVINTTKGKDDIDFTYNAIAYRGSAFIILAQYRSTEVNAAIASWVKGGVIGVTTTSPITINVYATLSYAPKWTIDKAYGSLVTGFFSNAGIPSSAHGGSSSSGWKDPGELTQCDDIFVLPHSEPTFATHFNLENWNRDFKGAIWAGCYAVSILENLGLNFLTTAGMLPYTSHAPGNPPYTYANSTDPVMQFMGSQDLASANGSEQIYLPKAGSFWNARTTLSITDSKHSQVPNPSPGPATVVAYGPGFNDPARGLVMYQGGHSPNGTGQPGGTIGPDHVALQRAFFNFSLMAVVDRQANNSPTAQILASPTMNAGEAYPVKFTVPAVVDLSKYQISWSSTSGTILPTSTSKDIVFTPTVAPGVKIALLTLVLTDNCGRQYFTTYNIAVNQCNFPPFTPDITIPAVIPDGQTHDLSFTAPANIILSSYKVKWSVSAGRIVGPDDESTVKYLPPYLGTVNQATITLTLTDMCDNVVVQSENVSIDHIIKNNGNVSGSKLISVNNDGLGYDYLHIDNIELYPENEMRIFNRWGNIVYESKGYDNYNVKFTGINMASENVTDGVFYYVLKINNVNVPETSVLTKGYFILKK